MDRTVAVALFAIGTLLLGLCALAWAMPTPADPYRTLMLPDGTRWLGPDTPTDMGFLVREGLHQAARWHLLLVGVCAWAVGLAALVRGGPSTPALRLVVVMAPLLAASSCGSVLFTPPDLLTTLLMFGLSVGGLVPIGVVVLAVVSRALPTGSR